MPEPKRPLKVFLSYASQDKLLVRELSRRLVGEGWIDTWQDEKNLLPGQDWRVKIEEAVEEADVVIICLSNHSVSKEGYVQKELRYAREIALEKPEDTIFLIPLRLDDCIVPRGLRFYQWGDFFGVQKEQTYKDLLLSLQVRHNQKLELEDQEYDSPKKTENILKELESQAIRYELIGDFWDARKTWYEIKRIDPLFPRVDIKIKELEREVEKETVQEKARIEPKNKKEKFAPARPINKLFYWFGGFAILALGIVLFSSLNYPLQPSEPTLEVNPSQLIATSTYAETIESTPTFSLTLTSIPNNTLAPISSSAEIMDDKGVSMSLVSGDGFISFYMDKYEVTNASYKTCVEAGVCLLPKVVDRYTLEDYSSHPVVYINLDMAETYCQWREARLPTGNEWEIASGWSLSKKFPWGVDNDCKYANIAYGISNGQYCVGTTVPVGSYELGKSKYNIYDLIGNVWEWNSDGYSQLRGGAWDTFQFLDETPLSNDRTSNTVGFRCAKDITQ